MNNEKEWDIKIKFMASKSAQFSFLPFNTDYMCLLHIQASEKYINHFYGLEQKFISVFQLRSARTHLNFRRRARKPRHFYSVHSNYSSCQQKSLLLLKQKCKASSGSHKNNASLFRRPHLLFCRPLRQAQARANYPAELKEVEMPGSQGKKLIFFLSS